MNENNNLFINLPSDLIFQICSFQYVYEINNLSKTCKSLQNLLFFSTTKEKENNNNFENPICYNLFLTQNSNVFWKYLLNRDFGAISKDNKQISNFNNFKNNNNEEKEEERSIHQFILEKDDAKSFDELVDYFRGKSLQHEQGGEIKLEKRRKNNNKFDVNARDNYDTNFVAQKDFKLKHSYDYKTENFLNRMKKLHNFKSEDNENNNSSSSNKENIELENKEKKFENDSNFRLLSSDSDSCKGISFFFAQFFFVIFIYF